MSLYALLVLSFVLPFTVGPAQSPPQSSHRIVLEVTAADEQWEVALNNVENVRKAFGADMVEIQVVVHGKALGMLQKTGPAEVTERVARLAKQGVVFAACRNTMKRNNVTEEDLLPEAKTVDSGIAEVVRKQEANWAYVKAGH